MKKPKPRPRRPSLDSEVRKHAKAIFANGMTEAMKAGMLVVCAQKLDEVQRSLSEINTILRLAGFNAPLPGLAGTITHSPVMVAGGGAPPPVEHPCVDCGRAGVRRSKPDPYNPTGSWFCELHKAKAGRQESENALDQALLGQAKPIITNRPKPVVVQMHTQATMRKETPVPEVIDMEPGSGEAKMLTPAETPVPGSASLADAMAALGMESE